MPGQVKVKEGGGEDEKLGELLALSSCCRRKLAYTTGTRNRHWTGTVLADV